MNYVDEEVFAAGNHVLRLAEEETLSSYVFLNADGTKTVYYLDEAVKFVDGDGNIQEKDVTLALSGTAYTTTRNDISLSVPTNPTNGITLIWKGHAVRILPQGGTLSDTVLDGNSIRYTDYYGEDADLVYTPTLSGVKEDIVLESYTGQNVFTFMLNTGGLNLYSANGRYYLAESKTATDRIELGDLVTFDANGRFSVGTMTSQTVSAGNIYRLTLTVDEAFLTDPDTVYPVSIDPTIRVSDDTTEGSIEDVNIYQGKPTLNANWSYMHVGHYDDTYGVGRILVRLTGLLNDEDYQAVEADEILTANFYLKEATGKAAAYIELYPHRGNSNWTESSVTWNTTGHTVGDIITTVSHPRSDWGCYDIKALLVDWKNGTNNANSGFVLRHSDEENATKGFYSSEYSATDYRPYFVLTYTDSVSQPIANGTYYINNLSTGKYIRYATSSPVGASGLIADIGNSIRWIVTWTGEAYTIQFANTPTKYLAVPTNTTSSALEMVTVSDGTSIPERCLWTIALGAYQDYRLQSNYNFRYLASNNNVLYTSTTTPSSSYNSYIWRFANTSTYRELDSDFAVEDIVMDVGDSINISVIRSPEYAMWSNPGDFTLEYYSGSSDSFTTSSFSVSASHPGLGLIRATHKVTGLIAYFEVFVNNLLLYRVDHADVHTAFSEQVGTGYSISAAFNFYTVFEALDVVLNYDAAITVYCNAHKIPKEFVQSVLFREVWCFSVEDTVADDLVINYYNYRKGLTSAPATVKDDSSTGVGQIFARTAIAAINNAIDRGIVTNDRKYDADNWEDVCYIWENLNSDYSFNIRCCSLVILDCQYEFSSTIPYIEFFELSEAQIKTILSRYNGKIEFTAGYGELCYEYYKIFEEYNQ